MLKNKTGLIEDVNFSSFCDRFNSSDTYKNNFSYNALRALYDYLENLSDDIGEAIEFDMVALCCEYSEYENAIEAASNYFEFEGMTFDPVDGGELKTVEDVEAEALKFLQDRTQVIEFNGGIIIQDF